CLSGFSAAAALSRMRFCGTKIEVGQRMRLNRFLPSLCAMTVFIAMTLLYLFGPHELYISILQYYGLFEPGQVPFLDFQNSLAAWECTRQGFDVIQSNPCDILNRPYNYGPWWMAFSFIPL